MSAVTYLARALDTPTNPFEDGPGALRAEEVALEVRDGTIVGRRALVPGEKAVATGEVVDLRHGVLLPGMVDTHVHFPQVRAIGGLGMPLLDWLERCALPEEARLADPGYAEEVADEFLDGLARAGTTTALVFGSHFASAVDALFERAERSGLRITAGQVLSDRMLRPELHTDPATAAAEGAALIERWHGAAGGRLRYAVTPRFSLSTSEAILRVCEELLHSRDDLWFTSHINENLREISTVAELFPTCQHYLDTYARHGLVGPRSVLAHNVIPGEDELRLLAASGAAVSHCPTSNAALGSGMFPLRRHLDAGVQVALGTDVGAGAGFSMLKEGLQAYYLQQLLGAEGVPLTPAHLLYLATGAGARALGLGEQVGDLGVGKQFDALWLVPPTGSTLDTALRHAPGDSDRLARIFVLGTPADVAATWVGGRLVAGHAPASTTHTPRSTHVHART
ncbi:Guanine deaminase [Serinicoccus hydrothermalis]|uniref:Guanine deaminase n=1 Tax=Serinicoccus hydrothermalis TaxID=1758689 RepID=A0A1B1NDV2_9MICO|nr:guanine deaminase [Serinicoccus hydrothermalis]ANS79612.1 Guanine deaminase [Serinicoccus hydrothermalis]